MDRSIYMYMYIYYIIHTVYNVYIIDRIIYMYYIIHIVMVDQYTCTCTYII